MLAVGAEIPNALNGGYVNGLYQPSVAQTCPDNDQDGWTTCNGDCNDSDANIHPGRAEACGSTTVDYNCNGLIGCADEGCGGTYHNINPNIPARLFVNGSPKPGHGTTSFSPREISTAAFPAAQRARQQLRRDRRSNPPVSAGALSARLLLGPFTSLVNGCTCSGNGLYLGSIAAVPSPVQSGQGLTLTIIGNGINGRHAASPAGSVPAVDVTW